MTPIRMFVVASLVALAGCTSEGGDTRRFEAWGEALAAVPVSADDAGLRGPVIDREREAMEIEIVHPDILWDARAVGFEEALRGSAEAVVRDVAHNAVTEAVVQTPAVIEQAVRRTGVTLQLGAFSSRSAAEAAWSRLEAHGGLAAAQPLYEPVERDGRTLIRLRAGPVAPDMAPEVCQAAGAGDWCASTARS